MADSLAGVGHSFKSVGVKVFGMAKFRALRETYGDYGPNQTPRMVHVGEVFELHPALEHTVRHLEQNGIIERIAERRVAPRVIVPANKAIKPNETK